MNFKKATELRFPRSLDLYSAPFYKTKEITFQIGPALATLIVLSIWRKDSDLFKYLMKS